MKRIARIIAALSLVIAIGAMASGQPPAVDHAAVARIREEGLQRSQVMDIAGYIVDVLGARLTNSEDMKGAQAWVTGKMKSLDNPSVSTFQPARCSTSCRAAARQVKFAI